MDIKNLKKLSADLALLVYECVNEGTHVINEYLDFIAIYQTASQNPQVGVFVFCSDYQTAIGGFEKYGMRIRHSVDEIFTGRLTVDEILKILKFEFVTRVEASPMLHLLLDKGAMITSLPKLKEMKKLDGNGVVIGIIDTGIDAKHPAFEGRIHCIWDCTEEDVNSDSTDLLEKKILYGDNVALCTDRNGHGTHVAGIAAGQHHKYQGVAPSAKLIVVKVPFPGALEIEHGVDFIFEEASKLKMPAVVNISLGHHMHPHDGSDSLSVAISRKCGPGKIVVCAAGNEGDRQIHSNILLAGGEAQDVLFRIPPDKKLKKLMIVGCYASDVECSLQVTSPSGIKSDPHFPTDRIKTNVFSLGDNSFKVKFSTPSSEENLNGENIFIINIFASSSIEKEVWELRLKNTSNKTTRIDMWILSPSEKNVLSPSDKHLESLNDEDYFAKFIGHNVSNELKISAPASAANAIAVGCVASRVTWPSRDGKTHEFENTKYIEGEVMPFSSPGPLRSSSYCVDCEKPDIVAPGILISCRSSNTDIPDNECDDPLYTLQGGTSQSSPFVAGLIALLLQENPLLTPDKIREMLRANAVKKSEHTSKYDNFWGYGLINAEGL